MNSETLGGSTNSTESRDLVHIVDGRKLYSYRAGKKKIPVGVALKGQGRKIRTPEGEARRKDSDVRTGEDR